MAEMKASYGFTVEQVAEGWKFTYRRPTYAKIVVPALLYAILFSIAGVIFAVIGAMFSYVCTFLLAAPIALFVAWVLFRGHRQRTRAPLSFTITPTHVVQGTKQYPRKDVSSIYIVEPSTGDASYTAYSGGSMYVTTDVVTAGVHQVGQGMSDAAKQTGAALRGFMGRSFNSINYAICFDFGEKRRYLATGLTPERTERLLTAVMEKARV